MNKDDKKIVQEFEKHAHPVDLVQFIMQKEILAAIKKIQKSVDNTHKEIICDQM